MLGEIGASQSRHRDVDGKLSFAKRMARFGTRLKKNGLQGDARPPPVNIFPGRFAPWENATFGMLGMRTKPFLSAQDRNVTRRAK
jgi:hypothetical protein